MNTNEVWVYVEQQNGEIADVSLELLGKAQDLAGKLSTKCGAILLGEKNSGNDKTLFQYGADIIYSAEDPSLKNYTPLPYTKMVCDIIENINRKLFYMGQLLMEETWLLASLHN